MSATGTPRPLSPTWGSVAVFPSWSPTTLAWEQELFDVFEAPESVEDHRGEPVPAGYSLARTKVRFVRP